MAWNYWCKNGCGKSIIRTFNSYCPRFFEYQCKRCGQYYINETPGSRQPNLIQISNTERLKIIDNKGVAVIFATLQKNY